MSAMPAGFKVRSSRIQACEDAGHRIGHRQSRPTRTRYCLTCTNESHRQRTLENRQQINDIKTQRGCADCGYRDAPEALDFDHLPGEEKVVSISALAQGGAWHRIESELAKCEVVCANCHRVRTRSRYAQA